MVSHFSTGKKESNNMGRTIEFTIEHGDISSFEADVVALKYARNFYGADQFVAHILYNAGISYSDIKPQIGECAFINTCNSIKAPYALFVGVKNLYEFGYKEIRDFAVMVLNSLLNKAPEARHLAMTIHGPGYGLDEVEALMAQFIGYLYVIQNGVIPPGLEYISIVELNSQRVKRLRMGFEKNIAGLGNISKINNRWAYRLEMPQKFDYITKRTRGLSEIEIAGTTSAAKPHVFAAMPFRKDMEDVFYYGIQSAAHANDLLCERVDQEAFTGDILDRVKERIETATVVIAELTGANPNVYLEVGYAWGKAVPTILLVKKPEEVCFDVRGQKCLRYEIIKELEESLTKELKGLLRK